MPDKFAAVWVSHSSLSDFLKCPRAYFLKNVYKDPQTRRKMAIMSPALALGQTVHEVIEALSVLPSEQRFRSSLLDTFGQRWERISGKKGGFRTPEQEQRYRERGEAMIRRVLANPGPLKNLAVKIQMELPYFWLSETDEIILCGKIDWLEYFPDRNSVHIIDFKTGKGEEDGNSWQLPIYGLLVANCQKRPIEKASYWYLDRDDAPVERPLPDLDAAREDILKLAKEVKLARKLERFKCPQGDGCSACRPYEAILQGKAELITHDHRVDTFILAEREATDEDTSVVL